METEVQGQTVGRSLRVFYMKQCRFCLEFKELDDFHRHPSTKDRHQSVCKECRLFNKNTKAKNKQLRKRYGITLDQYNEMFNNQNGCCAICGKHQLNFKVSLCVDHCHLTGLVRGLLCSSCNRAIGYFQESLSNIENAVLYLKYAKSLQHTDDGVPASNENIININV